MTTLEQKYSAYRNQLEKLEAQKGAWYEIASQKFSEGDKASQAKAYAEIDAIQKKIDALVNPFDENDELLGENDELL